MKIFKIFTRKEGKEGKSNWLEIGMLFKNDNGKIGGFLNNNPNEQIYVFEQEKKEKKSAPKQEYTPQETVNELSNFDDLGQDEVPF
jgi:hypothetical protein